MNNFYTTPTKKSNDEREITMESAPVQSKMAAVTDASGRISKPTSIDSLETNTQIEENRWVVVEIFEISASKHVLRPWSPRGDLSRENKT